MIAIDRHRSHHKREGRRDVSHTLSVCPVGLSPFYRWQLQSSKKPGVFPEVTQLGDGKTKVESKALCDTEN